MRIPNRFSIFAKARPALRGRFRLSCYDGAHLAHIEERAARGTSILKNLYRWKTSIGDFFITEREKRFEVRFDNQNLGSYATAAHAAEAAARGHCDTVETGIDTGTLGMSENLNDWQRVG
jgi:hypothetical protein